MNPQAQGQSLSIDAYEAGIRSQTGESPEAQRLRAIWEVNKEIAKNTSKLKELKTPAVKPR
jgi:hypothetical protein